MEKIDRIGEVAYNNFGSKMVITDYRKNKDIDVYFPKYNWVSKNKQYSDFKKGNIKCVYEERFYNKGYIGEGKYKAKINGKPTRHFKVWNDMLKRCYSSKYIEKHQTYKGCRVHDSWLNFQIFSEWYYNNFYQISEELMSLDKDILYKGNKIYSPDTCVFTPQRINSLFVKSNRSRGELPIGVSYKNKKYRAYCHVDKKMKYLGCYNTPEEAFQVYKNFKEKYIKEVAEEYKDKIPEKLYNAMITYEVEIDD